MIGHERMHVLCMRHNVVESIGTDFRVTKGTKIRNNDIESRNP